MTEYTLKLVFISVCAMYTLSHVLVHSGRTDCSSAHCNTTIDNCPSVESLLPSATSSDLDIVIQWPETEAGTVAVVPCPCGNLTAPELIMRFATRQCDGSALWTQENVSECNFTDFTRTLCHVTELQNAEVLHELQNLTSLAVQFDSVDVAVVASILEELSSEIAGNRQFSEAFLTVVNQLLLVDAEILLTSHEETNSSQRVLQLLTSVAEALPIPSAESSLIIPRTQFAVAVHKLQPILTSMEGQSFELISNDSQVADEIIADNLNFSSAQTPDLDVDGAIYLPPELFQQLSSEQSVNTSDVQVAYSVFLTDVLFQRRREFVERNSLDDMVGGIIMSASISEDYVGEELEDPIVITFQKNPLLSSHGSGALCRFWNLTGDSGYGTWSSHGCYLVVETEYSVVCHCNHLSNYFAILLPNITTEEEEEGAREMYDVATIVIVVFSCFCMVISSIGLLLNIFTFLTSKQLRSSVPGQLLLNLSFAMLGVYVAIVAAVFSIHHLILCAVLAGLLHYFFLAMGLAMAAEAVVLYIKLVKVFVTNDSYFGLVAAIVTWVIPFFIVGISVAPGYSDYYNNGLTFCRPKGYPFFFGLIVPLGVIFIFNWVVFAIIMFSLFKTWRKRKEMDANKSSPTFKQQFRMALALILLIGLGWAFAIVSIENVESLAILLFAIFIFFLFVAFQGFFIFFFFCVQNPDARKHWSRLLCCRLWMRAWDSMRNTTIETRASATLSSSENNLLDVGPKNSTEERSPCNTVPVELDSQQQLTTYVLVEDSNAI